MLLNELLQSAGIYYRAEGDESLNVTSITSDSRSAEKNSLFVCIRGRNQDGHTYAKEAALKGAIAIIAEDGLNDLPGGVTVIYVPDSAAALARIWDAWYCHPSRGMKLIAVTGTNGKTTTCFMLEAIFSAALHRCGIIGTVITKTPERTLDFPEGSKGMTTPEPRELYRILAEMKRDGAEYVFIEASSQALAQERLAPLSFDAAIFTNLSEDHLDFHGNLENYFLAKASLLEKTKRAFINLDDAYTSRYRAYARAMGCGAELRFYSASGKNEADYKAERINLSDDGISFKLCAKNTIREIKAPLMGGFNVDNCLSAASLALSEGIGGRVICEALATFGGVPGRLSRVKTPAGYGASVFIDYAHTPDALKKALLAGKELALPKSRLIVVFGCGGDRDRSKRPLMGRIASEIADVSVITSDNSRSELPEDIISEILSGFDNNSAHAVIPSRADAIRYAVDIAENGDVILLCGKGHEKYELGIGGYRELDESEIVCDRVKDVLRHDKMQKSKGIDKNEG
jgi:UDP-N-acetylmuramyl-tripeptide synthetase